MSGYTIETSKLTKFFGTKCVVYQLDLKVPEARVSGFLGPNAAGKTTTIKILMGNIRPTYGSATIFGMDVVADHKEIMKRVGYLPENPVAYQGMTAIRFMRYMGKLCGLSNLESDKRAKELLDFVGLGKMGLTTIGNFSAGQRQRIGFAQALVNDPDLLILDEPMSNLDPLGRVDFMSKIRELAQEQKKTVFVSSHILPEIQRMSDYVAIINEGILVTQGEVSELTTQESDEYLIVVSKTQEFLKEIRERDYVIEVREKGDQITIKIDVEFATELWKDIPRIVSEKGMELRTFQPAREPLETVFMRELGIKRKAYESEV